MKLLCLFLLVSGLLFAQPNPIDEGEEAAAEGFLELFGTSSPPTTSIGTGLVHYILSGIGYGNFAIPFAVSQTSPVLTGSATFPYTAVYPLVAPFYNQFPNGEVKYNPLFRSRSAAAVHLDLTTVQPVAPPDPQMIFLDGSGSTSSIIAIDLTTLTAVSHVVVPSIVGPFGIRPSATGSPNEVWVLNSGFELSSGLNEVSVVNLGAQSLLTNIVTSSIQAAVPMGIVFTNDGATAFEALKYDSPDSAGNNGALLVFDAVDRTLTSTMLLKFVPTALLMAPDGLTAYILSNTGTITYYDVLSGTSDLTVSTYPPGSDAGYPGASSAVYIHPDGTRLFWNVGVYLTVFDLTTRQVTNQFNSGLPTTVGRTFSLSQDGGRAYFSDQQGDVAILDTYYGTVLASFIAGASTSNAGAATSVFGGPPIAP
jgi:hypothetical protein